MGDTSDIQARAALWREAAEQTRRRARRVLTTGALRWDAPAAGLFRARVRERAAALRRLADLEDDVGAALDGVARSLAHPHRSLETAFGQPAGRPETPPTGTRP
jgi:hypothetical protein